MTISGRRNLLWCFFAVGLVFCLAPTLSGFYIGWKYVMKPIMEAGAAAATPPDSARLQALIQHDPIVNIARFGFAPVGVAMVIASLVLLRRSRQRPPPPLPADYGLPRGP